MLSRNLNYINRITIQKLPMNFILICLNIALDDYAEIKKYYKYLSCNCCFRLGNTNSKQVTDIPVGSDGPRPLSDLFFYHYENK